MHTLYAITKDNGTRYLRATSPANARVRAWKALGIRDATITLASEFDLAVVGAQGYDSAANSMERQYTPLRDTDNSEVEAQGTIPARDKTPRNVVVITSRERIRVTKRAAMLLQSMGLATLVTA